MRGHADRLVDDDDVVVVVDDLEAGHERRDDRRLGLRGPLHLEPAARGQAVRLAERASVERHSPGLDDLGREGARESEQPGERGIRPLPREPVGDRQAAPFDGRHGLRLRRRPPEPRRRLAA